jgi:hypothetical protein
MRVEEICDAAVLHSGMLTQGVDPSRRTHYRDTQDIAWALGMLRLVHVTAFLPHLSVGFRGAPRVDWWDLWRAKVGFMVSGSGCNVDIAQTKGDAASRCDGGNEVVSKHTTRILLLLPGSRVYGVATDTLL